MTSSISTDEISVIENDEEEEEENKDRFKHHFKLEKENVHEKHQNIKNPLKLLRL